MGLIVAGGNDVDGLGADSADCLIVRMVKPKWSLVHVDDLVWRVLVLKLFEFDKISEGVATLVGAEAFAAQIGKLR